MGVPDVIPNGVHASLQSSIHNTFAPASFARFSSRFTICAGAGSHCELAPQRYMTKREVDRFGPAMVAINTLRPWVRIHHASSTQLFEHAPPKIHSFPGNTDAASPLPVTNPRQPCLKRNAYGLHAPWHLSRQGQLRRIADVAPHQVP